MRDLRVHPAVSALVPADLITSLAHGPHPSFYYCGGCRRPGDLTAGEPTSLVVRRYPAFGVRRVLLWHTGCVGPQVTVASAADGAHELSGGRGVLHADFLDTGASADGEGPVPVLLMEDDDLVLTDAHAPGAPDMLRPGDLVDPMVSHALARGFHLPLSAPIDVPVVAEWKVRIGAQYLDLTHPAGIAGLVTERVAFTAPPAWRAAVRGGDGRLLVLVGRFGLTTALRPVARGTGRPRDRASQSAVTLVVSGALAAGRAVAARVPVACDSP